jgi:hypothetical protein
MPTDDVPSDETIAEVESPRKCVARREEYDRILTPTNILRNIFLQYTSSIRDSPPVWSPRKPWSLPFPCPSLPPSVHAISLRYRQLEFGQNYTSIYGRLMREIVQTWMSKSGARSSPILVL